MDTSVDIVIELDTARGFAERCAADLCALRERFDLRRFEYTRRVRIAPLEIPHSHPVLTLNTSQQGDIALLGTYLHEQMHWYVTWFSRAYPNAWRETLDRLRNTYPSVPVGFPEGARDVFSTRLHLLVNLLEIEACSVFLPRADIENYIRSLSHYRWIYATVLRDGAPLLELYRAQGLLPIKTADTMSPADLALAAAPADSGAD